MNLQDQTIKCFDCGRDFTFTVAEQEDFRSKGYTHPPKRCPACREQRKAERPASAAPRRADFSAPRRMFSAVCAECGKATQVPFEPRGDKPVYCGDCFRKVRPAR
ncbi:MAG: zinc-ribbon domain containing protein [Chloroflexi bacterium]|nr:zinc-ribbon domain containing protein [Chloroflexota bacterium]